LRNGVAKYLSDALRQVAVSCPANPVTGPRRVDSGQVEGFVGVDVAYANDDPGIHYKRLDRTAPAAGDLVEIVAVEVRAERLKTQVREQRMVFRSVGCPQKDPEAAWVSQPKAGAVFQA
jgi:hypothetical protein